MAYLPKEKILVEADSFNPAARPDIPPAMPPGPFTTNLVENLDRLKLDVDRVMSIHSLNPDRLTSVADMKASLGRK